MYDLTEFDIGNMSECGMRLRSFGSSSQSMEETADRIVHYLYDHLLDPETGKGAMPLVRFFKTHDYADLPRDLQAVSSEALHANSVTPQTKCLTLLATVGDEPAWNSRHGSIGHKVIPLHSQEMMRQFPMITALVKQLGLDWARLLEPDPSCLRNLAETTYNVFHVPTALENAYVPAQKEFVVPYGIRSVLGFGGILPSGNLFATIMFSKVAIPVETADLFRPLALSIKIAVLQHDAEQVFQQSENPSRT